MSLFPLSLLITAAVLLPNLLYIFFPPKNVQAQGKEPIVFVLFERIGQIAMFLSPMLSEMLFDPPYRIAMFAIMGWFLILYYICWLRYMLRGRDFRMLFAPFLKIPIPMAVFPVLYFIAASVFLMSPVLLVSTIIFAVGHLYLSRRSYLQSVSNQ